MGEAARPSGGGRRDPRQVGLRGVRAIPSTCAWSETIGASGVGSEAHPLGVLARARALAVSLRKWRGAYSQEQTPLPNAPFWARRPSREAAVPSGGGEESRSVCVVIAHSVGRCEWGLPRRLHSWRDRDGDDARQERARRDAQGRRDHGRRHAEQANIAEDAGAVAVWRSSACPPTSGATAALPACPTRRWSARSWRP